MKLGYNQYAPMHGVAPFRQVLAESSFSQYGHQYDSETEITVTAGATEAIASAIACSVREGDEVIIFTPAYDCYAPLVELHGGTPVYIQLLHPDYSIDWEQVKKLLNHRTRMIIINTPHNPTATALSHEDLVQLDEITANSNILILSDEVYEHISFEDSHLSVRNFPSLAQRSFVVGSLGKTFHITGWKIGYCLAPENLMEEFRKVHQFLVFSINTPIQYALADYLQNPANFSISSMYQDKRDLFLEAIAQSRFKPLPSKGSYYQLLDYSAITDQEDVAFAEQLTIYHKVASIPLSVFYNKPQQHQVLRFCFAKNENTLKQAGEKLSSI